MRALFSTQPYCLMSSQKAPAQLLKIDVYQALHIVFTLSSCCVYPPGKARRYYFRSIFCNPYLGYLTNIYMNEYLQLPLQLLNIVPVFYRKTSVFHRGKIKMEAFDFGLEAHDLKSFV